MDVETTVVVAVPAGAGQDRPLFIRSLGCERPTAGLLFELEKHFCEELSDECATLVLQILTL